MFNEFPPKLRCVKDICGNVSDEFRVTELWRKYETYMDINLNNMESCPELDSAELIQK